MEKKYFYQLSPPHANNMTAHQFPGKIKYTPSFKIILRQNNSKLPKKKSTIQNNYPVFYKNKPDPLITLSSLFLDVLWHHRKRKK